MRSGYRCLARRPSRAQGTRAAQLVDWLTDGGDNQRTGWAKNEKILTKQNVGSLKLLWTLETGNQPRALHSLMPVLVIGQLATANGPRQVGIVNGISDNLYGFDVETGKILWQKHWTYTPPAGPRRRRRRQRAAGSAAPRLPAAGRQQRHAGDRAGRTPRAAGRSTSSPATACCTSSTPRPARTSSRRTCSTPARAGR